MQCTRCKQSIPDSGRFCNWCGESRNEEPIADATGSGGPATTHRTDGPPCLRGRFGSRSDIPVSRGDSPVRWRRPAKMARAA